MKLIESIRKYKYRMFYWESWGDWAEDYLFRGTDLLNGGPSFRFLIPLSKSSKVLEAKPKYARDPTISDFYKRLPELCNLVLK